VLHGRRARLLRALRSAPAVAGARGAGQSGSIDVVRGAGSVRYGPQNVGGIINFTTRAIPKTLRPKPPSAPRSTATAAM
jgi:outer membrane receptor protein involved in Fe transport